MGTPVADDGLEGSAAELAADLARLRVRVWRMAVNFVRLSRRLDELEREVAAHLSRRHVSGLVQPWRAASRAGQASRR